MRRGTGSKTAVLVCKARAFGAATSTFADPTARALLPADARADLDEKVAHPRRSPAAVSLAKQAAMMVARTVAIDAAVRAAAAPQVVILGAGLDGRAWRMPELADSIVFEVDHLDSQREKRARIGALTQTAREVRFVAVDFQHDDLDALLQSAGHDVHRPTMWIWEGVVMYLTAADIERTLQVIQRRAAPGSHITIVYHCPGWLLPFIGLWVRLLGEPLRSISSAEEMNALLARFGFRVLQDHSIPTLAARISAELARDAKHMAHLRVVTAAC